MNAVLSFVCILSTFCVRLTAWSMMFLPSRAVNTSSSWILPISITAADGSVRWCSVGQNVSYLSSKLRRLFPSFKISTSMCVTLCVIHVALQVSCFLTTSIVQYHLCWLNENCDVFWISAKTKICSGSLNSLVITISVLENIDFLYYRLYCSNL
jgi:hypothetical protein